MKVTAPRTVVLILASAFLLWLTFGYFGIQALFTNTVINENPPLMENSSPSEIHPKTTTISEKIITVPQNSTTTRLALSGNFIQGDSTYTIKGKAQIVTQNETRTLVLSDFDVTNGPDLYIYFIATSSTENGILKERAKQGHFIQLAALKGNQGSQNYLLPADLDLAAYPVVSIWCRRFSRNFGSALLRAE